MPGLLPTIIRLATKYGPIVANEFRRNKQFRRAVETTADAVAGTAFRALSGKKKRQDEFIMRRGKQRFRCRKVR